MKIKNFYLENYAIFSKLEILLSHKVTVFVGNNGAGKTSLLQAITTALSWLVARIERERGTGRPIPEDAIKNGAAFAEIKVEVLDWQEQPDHPNSDEAIFSWSLIKLRKGHKSVRSSDLQNLTQLADDYRNRLTTEENSNLPLFVSYPVERVVLDIPLKIKTRHSFAQLDGYDNAMTQGVDFRRFFEWFREREDSENENGLGEQVFQQLLDSFKDDETRNLIWEKLSFLQASIRDRQLTAVRTAIGQFMPGFDHLRVQRRPRLRMTVNKNGETLDVGQLSQGEKSLMALVGDIARRLAMMNPSLENPLQGVGIVLIDEVDLHLHPQWQRSLIQRFLTTFPNCQFILSTHSPLIISDHKDILCYVLNQGELTQAEGLFGQDVHQVLLEVMETDIRHSEINRRISMLLDFIQNGQLNDAQTALAQLEADLPANNLELMKARLLLKRLEIRLAHHS